MNQDLIAASRPPRPGLVLRAGLPPREVPRPAEALPPTEEAVEIWRELAAAYPADSAPGLTESRTATGCSGANPRITRTDGLKVGCSATPVVLPAQMAHADAQKAHIARRCGRCSSHESSPGSQAGLAESVTVSDEAFSRENARLPALLVGNLSRQSDVAPAALFGLEPWG